MNEPDLEALERRLRTLPPLLDVPPSLVAPSVRAAVADPDSPARIRRAPWRSRGWSRRWSLAGVVGIAAAAAVAVAITITSQSGGHGEFQRIATLTGSGNASGYVAVGRANGAIEPVVVSISHLDPAPGDQYYEIWFQTGGQQRARRRLQRRLERQRRKSTSPPRPTRSGCDAGSPANPSPIPAPPPSSCAPPRHSDRPNHRAAPPRASVSSGRRSGIVRRAQLGRRFRQAGGKPADDLADLGMTLGRPVGEQRLEPGTAGLVQAVEHRPAGIGASVIRHRSGRRRRGIPARRSRPNPAAVSLPRPLGAGRAATSPAGRGRRRTARPAARRSGGGGRSGPATPPAPRARSSSWRSAARRRPRGGPGRPPSFAAAPP